jgi:hypothetical protein
MARGPKIRAGTGLNAHRLVAETAVEMANELFEVYAADNGIYRAMKEKGLTTEAKARKAFVTRVAPRLLEDARQSLVSCLAEPDDRVTPHMKQEIYEALIADNDLRANRAVAASSARIPKRLH